jgi:hypothetical protein
MMMRIGRVAALAGGAAAAGGAFAAGRALWRHGTADLVQRIVEAVPAADRLAAMPERFTPDELGGLPAPVARYFEFALTPGQPLVHHARFRQRGEFAMRRDRWRPMRAMQVMRAGLPAFVWDARIGMAPGLPVRVRDCYLAGGARMRAAVGALVSVVNQTDTPGLAESALARYLAEAALVPTALLPSAGVRWTGLGEDAARATLTDAGLTVTMDVEFGPEGGIARVRLDRLRDVNGTAVRTPFTGEWGEYRRVHGMMLPRAGEAAWLLEDGPWPYWRAEVDPVEIHWTA